MRRLLIKADDFRTFPSIRWLNFIRFCIDRSLPITAGLIGKSLESNRVCKELIKLVYSSKNIELWNHGYEHNGWPGEKHVSEFFRVPENDQYEALAKTQYLAREVLGVQLRAFGPPFNKFDSKSLRAVGQFSEIEYLFDVGFCPGFKTIPSSFYVECDGRAAGNKFNYELAQKRAKPFLERNGCFVLQIHPGNHWDEQSLVEFGRFIDYCEREGVKTCGLDEFFIASIS